MNNCMLILFCLFCLLPYNAIFCYGMALCSCVNYTCLNHFQHPINKNCNKIKIIKIKINTIKCVIATKIEKNKKLEIYFESQLILNLAGYAPLASCAVPVL